MIAYLALFQVATFKGWIDIMDDAIDSHTVREGGERGGRKRERGEREREREKEKERRGE